MVYVACPLVKQRLLWYAQSVSKTPYRVRLHHEKKLLNYGGSIVALILD